MADGSTRLAPIRALSRPSAAAATVTACLLIATALAASFGARQIDRRAAEQLDERAGIVAATIDRRVDAYLEKLFGIRGFMMGSEEATRAEFEEYLAEQRIAERFPGAQSVGFAEMTTLEGRDAYIDRVDADAQRSNLPYPRFSIRPNAFRPVSVVVDYIHPVGAAQQAFGFDLLSESFRRAAVTRSRDRARPIASPPLTFVTELTEGQAQGVLVFLPYFRGRDQTPVPPRRTELFQGVSYAALRFPDLMRGIVSTTDDLEVYDVGSVEDPVPARLRAGDAAFDLNGRPEAPDADSDESRIQRLVVAGRRWQVYYRPSAELVSGSERAVPWLIGGFGLLVAMLAGGVVQTLTTTTRRAEAIADARTEELKRSNEELERFAFVASHDLQQPLRTVSGFLQLLEHQMGEKLDPTAREYIGHALSGTKQMGTLIDDLLAYSRVTRDDRPLGPVPLDDVWDTAVEQLQASIEDSGARVSREELPVVHGDRALLVQVFANLVGNAVKYRGEAAPEVHARAERVNGGWEVAIQDNGIGIDPAHHARIFEMFRRLHTEDEYEGTGVGLAMAKRIVERSGGDIRVESEPGRGSRFVVQLLPGERKAER
jgi:signal transduction histidine kinase